MLLVDIKITRDDLGPVEKAQVIAEITAILQRFMGARPEHARVVIEEIEPENWVLP
jgi:phenylpyruvate tautomerase PptA (4-oxalocrotonate tautomerase family)